MVLGSAGGWDGEERWFCKWLGLLGAGFVHGLRVVVMGEKKGGRGMGASFYQSVNWVCVLVGF
ncbi:hypothetical protein Pyn_02244 [Prunus yedoensis var. nudiflora]|uniref:Transmembrane protein n=1 Tax=Prunus yedoensis var. nudiflora TaxID=2094558 RepID=A0A314YPN3_PRUYE|nr:hypothetical protein Pyn_02244 [Prunus yedoensis var. nudiflora]